MMTVNATRCIDDEDNSIEYFETNKSHSWLFSYPGKLTPDKSELSVSTTNETFVEPRQKVLPTQGKRKKVLERFYRQILAEEIKAEFDSDEVFIEPYETDYTENFKNPDDMPLPGECLSKNEQIKIVDRSCPNEQSKPDKLEEMKIKYPLYASRAFSFAAQATGRDAFGKKTTITKRPEENYDNIEY